MTIGDSGLQSRKGTPAVSANAGVIQGRNPEKIAVLCVDDEPGILRIAKEMLEMDGGFDVDTVQSADQAMAALKHRKYDVIVADYQMPDRSGLDLLAEIRKKADTPFILFTGRGHEDVAAEAINQGVDFYVRKGEDPATTFAELSGKILHAVEVHRHANLLKESEEKFRAFADLTYDWVYWESADNRYIYMSPSCRRITGYTPEDFYNDPGLITRIVVAEDRNLWERHRTEAEIAHTLSSVEFRILTKSGGIRWINHRCRKVYDANRNFLGRQVSNIDITDSAFTRLRLNEDAERYHVLYDQAPVPYLSLDNEGRFLTVNREWLSMMGYAKNEITGRYFSDLVRPAEVRGFLDTFRNFKIHGEIRDVKLTLARKDGSPVRVKFNGKVGYDRFGNFLQTHCILTDISPQEKAEQALAASESRLRSIIRVAPVGIGVVVDRVLHEVNDRICGITGYSREELIDRPARMLYPSQDEYDYVGRKKYGVIQKTGSGSVETVWKKKDGTLANILLSSTALVPGDLSQGVTFTALDITGRKQTELSLKMSEEKYRQIIETANDGILTLNESFVITAVNPRLEEILGFLSDELIGHPVQEIMFPGDLEAETDHMKERVRGKRETYEQKLRHRTGREVWCRISATPLFTEAGAFRGSFAMIADVTHAKRVEQDLRRSEEKYRDLVENASTIIMKMDMAGKITYLNEYARRFFGYSDSEIIGKPVLGTLVPEEESVTARDMAFIIRDALAHPEKYAIHENEEHRRNGDHAWIVWENRPQYDAEGRLAGIVSFGSDITERRKAEGALAQANKRFNLLNSITRHDILNQLTGLFGYLELSKDLHPDEKIRTYIDRELAITRTIRRMITLTKNYQDIGQFRPQWQQIGTIVRYITRNLKMSHITITENVGQLEVYADPLLEKVIFNLIDNAVHHGGEKLTVIRFSCETSTSGCVLICEDDGEGVRYEEREKIFSKGYGKNTGFGLFLAREILGITRYTIRENGVPGRGARFEILVPAGYYRGALTMATRPRDDPVPFR